MKPTKTSVTAAAVAKFGPALRVTGILSTVGPASNPYKRDGRKEFQIVIRRTDRDGSYAQCTVVNVTAPNAAEGWARAMEAVEIHHG